ncbi:hypothetical protein VST7929_03183 [Vibrio stylophorae]|uniref:Inner membrane component domain-containing protein n=1 Tax=Vibrio stylophorae TaxID=659351 RepID=A0ABN8DY21_9VIBR|nr:YccF domain-containing protein [Vibrio stylophorae]CAH0535696.1 hypothetical protein VST7929_03183 [Vibrio stylophorae]
MALALLGNIIWLFFGGWMVGLGYLLGAIVLFPLLPFLLPFISYAFWPFGRRPVSKKAIRVYQELTFQPIFEDRFEKASATVKFLANVVWGFTFGWVLALIHLICALMNLMACLAIVTIPLTLPNVFAHIKLMPVALCPFGTRLVDSQLADEIEVTYARSFL